MLVPTNSASPAVSSIVRLEMTKKIDCEWCEWFTWPEWLDVDIRQILVETHNAPMPQARDLFFNLHDRGFVIFSKEANYENGGGGAEFALVRLSTDFFLNDTMYYKLPEGGANYVKEIDGNSKELNDTAVA